MANVSGARGWLLALLLVVAPTASCTSVASLSEHGEVAGRCLSNDDCWAHDRSTVCDLPTRRCVKLTGYCSTNEDCIDRNGAETYICQKGATPVDNHCTALLSTECSRILADPGDLKNDDAILVGMPWMNWAAVLSGGVDGVDLARKTIRDATAGGLPPLPGKKKQRPLVVLACDVPLDHQERYMVAVDHLIDVGVNAMVGPLLESWITYAMNHGTSRQVAVFTPNSPSQGFAGDTTGRFFTNGPPPGGSNVRDLIANVWEKRMRAKGVTRDVKIALMTTGLAADIGVAQYFVQHLTLNEKPASAPENATNFLEADYGDTSKEGPATPSLASASSQVIAFQPDIVIVQGDGAEYAIDSVEGAIHPYWVVPTVAGSNSLANFMETQPGEPGQTGPSSGLSRVLGERAGRPYGDARVNTFIRTFNGTPEYQDDAQGQYGLGVVTYDFLFYIAYAYVALGAQPVTGKAIGDTILSRFQPGAQPGGTSSQEINATIQALQAGRNVDMNGTLTIGNFKPDGTLVYVDETVFCFDSNKNATQRMTDSGLTWRSDQPDHLSGTLGTAQCPFP